MKRRLVALVLSFVLVQSLTLPVTAANAEQQPHEVWGTEDSLGAGSSTVKLEITEGEAPCEHVSITYTFTSDGKHNGICQDCGELVVVGQACTDVVCKKDDCSDSSCTGDQLCDYCESAVECEHRFQYGVDTGDNTTHNIVCANKHCAAMVVEGQNHVDSNNDRECDICGFVTDCEHDGGELDPSPSENETHTIQCAICQAVIRTEDCTDTNKDLQCDLCGQQLQCKHEGSTWKDNGDGTHTQQCPIEGCEEFFEPEEHTFPAECPEGAHKHTCEKCDYEEPNCSHPKKHWAADSNNKTHTQTCDCCGTVTDGPNNHEDTDADGLCDDCGFNMSNVGAPILVADVPTELSISATQDGVVSSPTNAYIRNHNVDRAVKVAAIEFEGDGWDCVALDSNFAGMAAGTKSIGISFRGDDISKGSLTDGQWVIGSNDRLPLNMACKIAAQTSTAAAMEIGTVSFTLEWVTSGSDTTSPAETGSKDQEEYNKSVEGKVYSLTFQSDHGTMSPDGTLTTDSWGRVTQLPAVKADAGYVFTGWYYTPAGGSKTELTVGATLSSDIAVTAEFRTGAQVYLSVKKDDLPEGIIFTIYNISTDSSGMVVYLPEVKENTSGKTLIGWQTEEGSTLKLGDYVTSDTVIVPVFNG